ncbi:MAG: O-antigen ligase family protein, partial [Aggregatilineales bacterium]
TEGMMLLYIFVVFISLFIGSGINQYTLLEAVNVGKDFILILIIVQLATEETPWKKSQWMLVIMAAILSILTVYQTATGDYVNDFFGLATSRTDSVAGDVAEYIDIRRVGGPLGDPNFYAQILLMVFPIAMYRALDEKNTNIGRIISFSLMGLIGIAIVLTYSRAALLVLVAICGLIILERRMNPIKVGMIMVVVFTVLLPVMPEGYTERILSLFGGDDEESSTTDVSVQGRASEMIIAGQMFEDYPVFGIGYALYEENYQTYNAKLGMDPRIELRQAHSLYLESLGETGVMGFITMMGMYAAVLWGVWKARMQAMEIDRHDLVPWVSGLGLGLLAYLMSSFFLHDDYVRYLRISLALAASASVMVSTLVAQHKAHEDEKPKNKTTKSATFVNRPA